MVFQFYGKVGTEKTKSQGGIFMHMADALVTPAVAGTMYACSAAVAAYSIRKVRLENDPKKIPLMSVMGAFVFFATLNYPKMQNAFPKVAAGNSSFLQVSPA